MIRRLHPGVCVVLAFALVALWVAGAFAGVRPVDRRFTGKFELVPLFERGRPMLRNGHSYYAVRNALAFRTDAGELLQVHGGQTTDLASIPQVVWPLLPPDGPWAEAAVFHDVCYRSRGSMGFPPKHIVGRAQPFRPGRVRRGPARSHGRPRRAGLEAGGHLVGGPRVRRWSAGEAE
jgi:hypothetical protein